MGHRVKTGWPRTRAGWGRHPVTNGRAFPRALHNPPGRDHAHPPDAGQTRPGACAHPPDGPCPGLRTCRGRHTPASPNLRAGARGPNWQKPVGRALALDVPKEGHSVTDRRASPRAPHMTPPLGANTPAPDAGQTRPVSCARAPGSRGLTTGATAPEPRNRLNKAF